MQSLNVVKPGSSRTVTKTDVSIGSTLQSLTATLDTKSEVEARQAGYFRKSKTGAPTNFLAALLPIVSIVATVLFQHTEWGAALLVPSFVGLFSNKTQRTRLTDSGAAMQDQVCGLRTALSTPASVDRFDYALRARYFAQFLPWAVALDLCGRVGRRLQACRAPSRDPAGTTPATPRPGGVQRQQRGLGCRGQRLAGAVSAYAAHAVLSSSSGGGGGSPPVAVPAAVAAPGRAGPSLCAPRPQERRRLSSGVSRVSKPGTEPPVRPKARVVLRLLLNISACFGVSPWPLTRTCVRICHGDQGHQQPAPTGW